MELAVGSMQGLKNPFKSLKLYYVNKKAQENIINICEIKNKSDSELNPYLY
jgi:hypothetical protein